MSKGYRLNGLRPAYRADHMRLRGLTNGAYRLYNLYIDLTSWDSKYPSFGYVKESDTNIAAIWNIDKSTLSRYRKELISSGFIKVERQKIKVIGAEERYLITPAEGQRRVKDELEFEDYDNLVGEIQPSSLKITIKEPEKTAHSDPIVTEALVSFSGDIFDSTAVKKRKFLIEQGFFPESLNLICFCGSGKRLLECCALEVHESLKESEK